MHVIQRLCLTFITTAALIVGNATGAQAVVTYDWTGTCGSGCLDIASGTIVFSDTYVLATPVSATDLVFFDIDVGVLIADAGGSDLTRVKAEQILNGEGRGYACRSKLDFLDGGLEKAESDGVFSRSEGMPLLGNYPVLGKSYKVAEAPDGGTWWAKKRLMEIPVVEKWFPDDVYGSSNKLCLPGKVEITAIADAPFATGTGNYKLVDFIEVVALPAELGPIKPYVYLRYRKTVTFQKTDVGWRATNKF